jgi:UDP-N-acetylmuramoylalanine--D-glutamate ligase
VKKVLVLGLGKTGLSACRYLHAQGIAVCVAEESRERLNLAQAEGYPSLVEAGWEDVSAVVVSPGIPWCWPTPHPVCLKARQLGIPLITDVDLFMQARLAQAPHSHMIAITGTNGKSTTTALMHHVLQTLGKPVVMGGNIGVPVLDLLCHSDSFCHSREGGNPSIDAVDPRLREGDKDFTYVLELSSYQLELSHSVFPQTAILLNITPDHLGRHGGMAGYIAAKARIFEGLSQGGTGVISVDDAHCRELYNHFQRDTLIPISTEQALPHGVYVEKGQLVDALGTTPQVMGSLEGMPTLRGPHNWQNMLAVYAALRSQGLSGHRVVEAFRTFPGLAHRQELVGTYEGVTFINDSKATNVESVSKALPYYENIYWILGGQAKEGGLQGLEPWLKRIRHAYLIGEAAPNFAAYLASHSVPYTIVKTLENAVPQAAQAALADPNGQATVLLSPACASWDQFASFEARGDAFRTLARTFINKDRPPHA